MPQIDLLTVDEARVHLKRFGSQTQPFINAIDNPANRVVGVVWFKRFREGILQELRSKAKIVGDKYNVPDWVESFFFIRKVSNNAYDGYSVFSDTYDFSEAMKSLAPPTGTNFSPKMAQYLEPGYFRVLTQENAASVIKPIYENAKIPDKYAEIEHFVNRISGKIGMGEIHSIVHLHHVNKRAIIAAEYMAKREGTKIDISPFIIPEMPGHYDIFFPISLTEDLGDNWEKKMAELFEVDKYHPLMKEEARADDKSVQLRPSGYMVVCSPDEAITFFQREGVGRDPESKAQLLSLASSMVDPMRGSWHLIRCHNISAQQAKRLKDIDDSCLITQMANGAYQWICGGKMIFLPLDKLEKIAKGLGLQFFESTGALEESMNLKSYIADTYKSDRITPEAAIRVRDTHRFLLDNWYSELYDNASWYGFDGAPTEDKHRFFSLLSESMRLSETVIWTDNMWRAAINGADTFTGTTVDEKFIRNVRAQFWHIEHPGTGIDLGLEADFQLPEGVEPEFLYISRVEEVVRGDKRRPKIGISMGICFSVTKSNTKEFSKDTLPHWRFLPPVYADEPIQPYMAPTIAALSFMNLEIISKERIQPNHAYRKQAKKENRPLPEIHTIYLRRTKAAKKNDKHLSEDQLHEAKRKYSVQFMVQGFWRNQYYPSTGEHKPKWIKDFFKGDPNLPFQAPRKRVYAVKR
jgi:hypothetical protein